jgi:pyruvate dehydrogenase E2 component (dihydrolipoamide acetyltransferase)
LSAASASGAPKASGLARKIAAEQGVGLAGVEASGRIMAADVRAAAVASSAAAAASSTAGAFEACEVTTPMSGMRRIIAQRMRESVDTSPTVTFDISVDVTVLKSLRADLAGEGRKISFTDLLAYVVSRLLLDHPLLNCRIEGDNIITRNYVNLGIAVALEEGLLVPVVANAHLLSLAELSLRIKSLAEGARGGSLSPDALMGGSFTITNLGMYGIESFTPIINQPEVAILGVNAITETPVVIDGEVRIRPLMKLSLTTDHRAVDGSVAAQFLMQLKKLLEKPALLL